jgi:predicted ArsR family transcriptional regulator
MAGRNPRITTDDVLTIFTTNDDRCEPFTAPEIADQLDCHRNTARNKLEDLVFTGDLATKKASASGRVYWRPCDRDSDAN